MAITSSAKKANRVSARKQVFNVRRKREMRDAVKEVRKIVTTDVAKATELLSSAYKAIDKAAKRGVIKANTASRKKSRLAKFITRAGEKK
jgi:small subunit ribosomal protein S20